MKQVKGSRNEMGKQTDVFASENIKKMEQAAETIADNILNKGMIPQDALGLTNEVVEGIYEQAYRLYNNGKYEEASHLFRMLVMLNSMEVKYLLGLAACMHMLKNYQAAVELYTLCAIMDPSNPLPHYHSSDCFIQMGDIFSAKLSLQLTIQRAGENPQYEKIKERAFLHAASLTPNVD